MTSTVTCGKCGNMIEITDLLDADLRLIVDSQAAEIERLRGMIDQTADGVLVPDTNDLFCPNCGNVVRQEYDICYCDWCANPDDYGQPPLPLFYSACYADQSKIEVPK